MIEPASHSGHLGDEDQLATVRCRPDHWHPLHSGSFVPFWLAGIV
jgi:hypothetical protein